MKMTISTADLFVLSEAGAFYAKTFLAEPTLNFVTIWGERPFFSKTVAQAKNFIILWVSGRRKSFQLLTIQTVNFCLPFALLKVTLFRKWQNLASRAKDCTIWLRNLLTLA